MLFGGNFFEDEILFGEIVWQNWNILVIFGFKCELFRNDVLLCKVEGTDRPVWVTGEKFGRLFVGLLEALLHRPLPQSEAIEELFANFFSIFSRIFLILYPDLLGSSIFICLYFLGRIYGLLLTNRSVKIDVLLLKLRHGVVNFGHQLAQVVQLLIVVLKDFSQFSLVSTCYNLIVKHFEVPQSDIKNDFICGLTAQKEKIENLEGGLLRQTSRED